MATFDDPYSLQRIMENLPAIQKQMRRSKRLRGLQGQFEGMRDREQPLGSMVGGGKGSFYEVPEFYVPNYSGMADKIVGGLGGYFAGKQADTAEDEYNALANPEIIGGVQQMSTPDTEQAMAGALGIQPGPAQPPEPPGPASAGASPMPPFSPMGPRPQMPGMGGPPEAGGENPPSMPSAGSSSGLPAEGRQQAIKIAVDEMNPQQQEELRKVVQSMIAVGMDDDVIEQYVGRAIEASKQQPGQTLQQPDAQGNLQPPEQLAQQAVPPQPPPQQGPGPTEQVMAQALGTQPNAPRLAPDGSPLATDETIRAYLGMIGGPDMKDVIGKKPHVQSRYVDGDGNVVLVMSDATERATGRKSNLPTGTVTDADGNVLTYGKTSAQGTGTQQLTGPGGRPVKQLTPGQEQTQKTTAQIEAEAAGAAQSARTEELKTEGKKMGEVRAEARAKLPGLRIAHAQLDRAANDLLKMPGLDRIFGGSWMGALPDEGVLADIAQGGQSLADPDAADAFAKWQGLKGKIYSGAFETLRGGGQITERETQRVADAYAAMSRKQTPAQFKKSMQEMLLAYREGVAKMEAAASGGLNPGDEVPAAAAPSDPRAKLRSKYGL